MENRNRRNRNSERMDRDYEGTLRPRGQQEQFQDDRQYGQMGDAFDDYDDTNVMVRPRYRDDENMRGRFGENRQSGQATTYGEGNYNYGAARPRNNSRRGFDNFDSNDIGGRDFAGPRQDYQGRSYQGGYGNDHNVYAGGYASSGRYTGDYGERGFFDKAGDEIASWFGDEDAERRREMDHRGRGPSNYTRSDERILEDTCDVLTQDRRTDASDVTVTVQKGEVTLDGTVSNRMQKRRAEDLAHDISGVSHVQNNLRINETSSYETSQSEKL